MTTEWPPRAPGSRGRLGSNSLTELLVFALEQRFDGSLVVETIEGQKSALTVLAGGVQKVRTAYPVEPLGRLLLDTRQISPAQLESGLLRAGQTGQRLGQTLVALGALSNEELASALTEQLARRVAWVGRLPDSSAFGFYPGRDFLTDLPLCEADPLALIWRSLSDALASARQGALLISLTGRKLRLHPAAAPERFALSPQEQMVVNALRTRPRALEELRSTGLLDAGRLQRLVLALALTNQLDYGQREAPLDAASNAARVSRPPLGSQPSLLPGPRSSLPAAAARNSTRPSSGRPSVLPELAARASSPPRSAGASTRAPSSAARTSVAPLLPPRSVLPPSSIPPRRNSQPEASRTSARPGAVTGAPSARRSESAGSLHPTDPVVLARARANFEGALAHVQRQQPDAAEKLARKATEEDTGNAEYLALHAWLRAQLGELVNTEHAGQIVAALDRAAFKARESVSIRFYRGQVLNRLGREEEAVQDFRFVLRHDPDHVEAARELRLHQMRKGGEEKKRPSLLAKLFLR